jgi:hypothetical protein
MYAFTGFIHSSAIERPDYQSTLLPAKEKRASQNIAIGRNR